jgi:hypothetical protein
MFFLSYSVFRSSSSLCLTVAALSFIVLASAFMISFNLQNSSPLHDHAYATLIDQDTSGSKASDSPTFLNSSLAGSIRSNNSNLQGDTGLGNSNTSPINFTSAGPQPGTLQIPYTGLSRYHISPEDADLFGLNENTYAMLITEVEPRSPAAIAGVRGGNLTTNVAGDIIKIGGDTVIGIDGNDTYIRTNDAFLNYLQNEKRVGENMTITLLRGGQIKDVNLTIGALPRFLWYDDNDEGIRIKYPSDWEISESESAGEIVTFLTPHEVRIGNETEPAAGIFVLISPAGNVGLDDLATREQTDTREKRNLGISLTSLSNLPAYETVFYDYSENRSLKKFSSFTIKDEMMYRIDFVTDPSRYDDYLPLATEVIRSFQFTR